MGIKDQLYKIKDNWLLIAAIVTFLLFANLGVLNPGSFSLDKSMGMSESIRDSPGYDGYNNDFAPEEEERKKIKTASMSTETERGQFHSEEQKLKNIVSASGSYVLNENVNKHGVDRKSFYSGSYQLKVDTSKYTSVITQLKDIGEIQSFRESETDITGQYTNQEINLEVEKSRLDRYRNLYDEANNVEEKLNLNDRIFEQERRVKYLEDRINNLDQRIEYTTVSFSMSEKRSDYINVTMVKFASLVRTFVGSFNALLVFLSAVLPWAALAFIVWLIYRFFRT